MSFFISQAHAQAPAPQVGQSDPMISILMMVGLFVFFYFIAIRPQRKRQKEHEELVTNLAKGDEVVTTSGILGKITKLEDEFVALKVAENVELKFQKHSVHAVLPKGTLKKI